MGRDVFGVKNLVNKKYLQMNYMCRNDKGKWQLVFFGDGGEGRKHLDGSWNDGGPGGAARQR